MCTNEVLINNFIQFLGAVGAIDCTHIFVKVEKEQQDSYLDRFKRHSINLLAVCDSRRLFTYIFVGFPGSAHDSRVSILKDLFGSPCSNKSLIYFNHKVRHFLLFQVLENSIFYRNIEEFGPNYYFFNENRFHLIGDSGFPLKTWLITPYRGDNLSRIQRHHNHCLSSERIKIEHSFGILKGRWRRLQYINTYNICKAIEISMAACVLQNFCLLHNDLFDENCVYDINNVNIENIPNINNRAARLKRDQLANDIFNR